MLNALSNDSSPFKTAFMTRIALFILFIVTAFMLNQYYVSTALSNIRQKNIYASEAAWLNAFNVQEAKNAKACIWEPIKAHEASSLVASRLNLFKEAHLKIVNVRQQQATPLQKGKRLKALTYNITIAGTWENMVTVLNKFEQDNSVVITGLSLSSKAKELTAEIVFNVYHS